MNLNIQSETDKIIQFVTELNKLCLQYKKHLESYLNDELEHSHRLEKILNATSSVEPSEADPEIIHDKRWMRLVENKYHYNNFIHDENIPQNTRDAVKKYKLTLDLTKSLNQPKVDAQSKLKQFEELYDAHKSTLIRRRDSTATKFIKKISQLLSISADKSKIWKTQGAVVSSKINTMFHKQKHANDRIHSQEVSHFKSTHHSGRNR